MKRYTIEEIRNWLKFIHSTGKVKNMTFIDENLTDEKIEAAQPKFSHESFLDKIEPVDPLDQYKPVETVETKMRDRYNELDSYPYDGMR